MFSFPLIASGISFGLSLIVAIGAQNIYVLRQGLLRTHILPVVAICIASDWLLMSLGISGFGVLVDRAPWLITALRVFGAAFLLYYAYGAYRRARHPQSMSVTQISDDSPATSSTPFGTERGGAERGGVDGGSARPDAGSRAGAVAGILAVTYLNPHVYLDTIVLMGSVANSHGDQRWSFGAGMMLASLVWFLALGYGSRVLTPVFARPTAWRVLDSVIVVIMVALAVGILLPLL